jgi:RNA polymerase sigma-70 factor (ECF subfamily)
MCEQELAAALAGDLDMHFERLVIAYQHRVFGFVLRLSGSRPDAEEIAQDTFLRAYRALSGYPPERVRALRLMPWLYQIALNLFRNHVRRVVPRTVPLDASEDDGAALEIADNAREDPETRLERAEAQGELARLVAALPPHFRAAVVLRHVEGRTYDEMARILDAPVGTVKSHTHRGTALLRTMLADRESEVRA